MSIGIYKLTSPSGKVYIGQSINIERRWCNHHMPSSGKGHLQKAIAKYGRKAFIREILKTFETRNQRILDLYEEIYILVYDAMNPDVGYNMKSGGHSSYYSEDARRRMSEAQRKRAKPSEETRQRMREGQKLRGSHGPVSQATKDKIAVALTGRSGKKHTPESRKKMSESRKALVEKNLTNNHTKENQ